MKFYQLIFSTIGFLAIVLAGGCAVKPVVSVMQYDRETQEAMLLPEQWAFDGRLGVRTSSDSWTANISWEQLNGDEKIRLFGPFGQGGATLYLTEHEIAIDQGDGDIRYVPRSDEYVAEQLGVSVPINSLQYWVLGMTSPENHFKDIDNGFIQNGWEVLIPEMQNSIIGLLPRRINMSNAKIKIKLLIDEWKKRN